MKKAIKLGGTALAVGVAMAGMGVMPAHAGNLLAYQNSGFNGVILNAASAPYIDVADNLTSSVRNQTSSTFSGRNVQSLVSFEVFSFSAGSSHSTLGGANDQIDHFDRK